MTYPPDYAEWAMAPCCRRTNSCCLVLPTVANLWLAHPAPNTPDREADMNGKLILSGATAVTAIALLAGIGLGQYMTRSPARDAAKSACRTAAGQ